MAEGDTIMINNAKIIARLEADGALIHGIDKVILPGSFEECPAEPTMAPVAAPTESPPAAASDAFAAKLSFVFAFMTALIAL